MYAILQLILLLALLPATLLAQGDVTHAPDVALRNRRATSSTLRDTLISYYELSTTNDSHGTFNLFTNSGPTTFVAGKNGNAYDVSVGPVFMQNSSSFSFNSKSYTISTWFVASNAATDQTIVAWIGFGGVVMRIAASKANFYHYDGAWKIVIQSNTLSSGTWYHYVVRYNLATLTSSLYINGEYKGQTTAVNACNASSSPVFRIGQEASYYYANGLIDETAIWYRALTDAEIEELYNSGAGKFYSSF